MSRFSPLSEIRTPAEFTTHLERLQLELPFDVEVEPAPEGPLAQPVSANGFLIGNRLAILPLEGWDSDIDGRATADTVRRWSAFGRSGAELVWGESAAVRPDGRSSPGQLLVSRSHVSELEEMRQAAIDAHIQSFGAADGFKVGIQLTHSGRYSHPAPSGDPAPVAVRHHPYFDVSVGPPPDAPLMSDDELHRLIDDFVDAASTVADAGFDFVDLKACHGYLGHELLSAFERPGKFGGSLENRTRFLRTVISGVRDLRPELKLAVRISAFDTVSYVPGEDGVGRPITSDPYRYWFGTDESGHQLDLSEPIELLTTIRDMGVDLICVTGSSPYNARHLQRPTLEPKPGEYEPPEDPLFGVARHIAVTGDLKRAVPGITTVGSGYSYLQQWLPHVAQAAVRSGATDLVGIARMHVAYPEFCADLLAGKDLRLDLIRAAF